MSQGTSAAPPSAASEATLLVVEDDATINQAVTDRLVAEGFRVVQAFDGPGAVQAHADHAPDLVVLDLMLPGFDGLEVCRRIQAERPVPVLMLTARADETDLLVGLGVGADDYVTKPFRMREVVARIRALLRRVERARGSPQTSPPARRRRPRRRPGRRAASSSRRSEVHLTPLEFDLLLALAAEPGAVRGRDDLMQEVWGWADARGTRTLDSHVKALRSKIGPERVRTVHGVGYALEARPRAGAPR